MGSIHLIGGGWDEPEVYRPFLDAAGLRPQIACVVLDQGDGQVQFSRWATVLRELAPCLPVPVLVPVGAKLSTHQLGDVDGLLVCGGLTPAYASSLAPMASHLQDWLADRPYCGFSAGAAIAATRALVGGWREGEVEVCPEDAGEDLDQVAVVDGLGLVDLMVDVHCAQWGTLPRLIAALGPSGRGVGLDENTALQVVAGEITVTGLGAAHQVVVADGEARVRTYRAGSRLPWG
ncbi:MAG: cyanophycinase [Frankiales bacterium]|jgi:cyanophycinase|nr:cyanophycinase [Frankiales bacterium]